MHEDPNKTKETAFVPRNVEVNDLLDPIGANTDVTDIKRHVKFLKD